MKTVKAVAPYFFEGQINFKHKAFDAWAEMKGGISKSHYPSKMFHGFVHRLEMPQLMKMHNEARLHFVQPRTLRFDTFPNYAFYEIIPFVWDCWPDVFDLLCNWLKKHSVKTLIISSSQMAERIKERFPNMNVLFVTEGIDVNGYDKGLRLKDRDVDLLEYGRGFDGIVNYKDDNYIVHVNARKGLKTLFSQKQLIDTLSNSKITAACPKIMTSPSEAKGIETLTQRYWEGMLSRVVLLGHAPKELTDLLGYNPVIELDKQEPDRQLREILANIEDYQELVDKNYESALKYGDWKYSMGRVMDFLLSCGYKL